MLKSNFKKNPKEVFSLGELKGNFRLVAYYSGETQNMNPELRYVDEAEHLIKPLIEKSFQNLLNHKHLIVDQEFVDCLEKRTVFTFEDEEGHLFSYFPTEGRVRISNIRINRAAHRPPYQVKTSFRLGEPWCIISPSKIRKELKLKIISKSSQLNLLLCDYAISISTKGFIFKKRYITISGKSFPNGNRFVKTLPFRTTDIRDFEAAAHADNIGYVCLAEQSNKWILNYKKNNK